MKFGRMCLAWLVTTSMLACASSAGTPPPTPGAANDDLVAIGHGRLSQEDFTLTLATERLLIKVTPLSEAVIRLAAPDTYQRLHGLAEAHRAALEGRAGPGGHPMLVSFFSRDQNVAFEPEDLTLSSQGIHYRPVAISPVTPGWGSQRLRQEETQSAIYAYDRAVNLDLGFTVEYGDGRDTGWDRILSTLRAERARVRARAGRGVGGYSIPNLLSFR